jgi:translation initiation factor IF-2
VPSESLPLGSPGSLPAQTAAARRSVQPASSGQASSPWSTPPGRQPWHRSPVGVHHRVSTHPGSSSGIRRSSRLVSSPSGVRSPGSSWCPAVRPSAVHPSGVRPSGVRPRPVSGLWCPPVQRPAGWVRPVVRTRPSPPILGGGVGPRSVRRAPVTTGTGRVPVGCRAVERFGRRPSRPGRGQAVLPSSRGGQRGVGGGPGRVGGGGGACPLSDQAGQAGVRSAVAGRRRCGTGGGCGARWPRLPRGCRREPGWRPRWVVVAEPAARVDGPERADGRAGSGGRAAPARPRLAAGAPGWLPAAL